MKIKISCNFNLLSRRYLFISETPVVFVVEAPLAEKGKARAVGVILGQTVITLFKQVGHTIHGSEILTKNPETDQYEIVTALGVLVHKG